MDSRGISLKIEKKKREKGIVFDGIRTHASEETAALMQRLRPLGHEHLTKEDLLISDQEE